MVGLDDVDDAKVGLGVSVGEDVAAFFKAGALDLIATPITFGLTEPEPDVPEFNCQVDVRDLENKELLENLLDHCIAICFRRCS